MAVSELSEHNTPFEMHPDNLKIDNKPLIPKKISHLLNKRKIKITLDVFDSDIHNGVKPTIVFIHGNSTSKKVFSDQIKYYSNNYRVIAFDLIGHGLSTKISNIDGLTTNERFNLAQVFYNPFTMIAGVRQLLEAKAINNAHLVGWSLGGHIAYGVAIENPQLIASITTIGSPPIKFSTKGIKKGLHEWFVDVLVPDWINNPKNYSIPEAENITYHMGLNSSEKYFIDDLISTDPQMRKYLFLELNKYDSRKYIGTALDAENFAKSTSLPLCLIVGEKDCGIKADYIETFSGKFLNKSSRVVVIKDAPHAVFKTHTDKIHEIIDKFIE